VFYSTQALEKESQPPRVRLGANPSLFNLLPKKMKIWGLQATYGLVRFRQDINHWGKQSSETNLRIYPDYSDEQFDLATKLGWNGFFKFFKEEISQTEISVEKELGSMLRATCTNFKDRVKSVLQGESAALKIQGCFSAADFDAYSTPVGDSGKIQEFFALKDLFQSHLDEASRNPELFNDLELVFSVDDLTPQEQSRLHQICSINIDQDSAVPAKEHTVIHLNHIFKTLKKGSPLKRKGMSALHFNPNVSKYRRWGIEKGFNKNCWEQPGYYGFPDHFLFDQVTSK
jgi:hypothetical protein